MPGGERWLVRADYIQECPRPPARASESVLRWVPMSVHRKILARVSGKGIPPSCQRLCVDREPKNMAGWERCASTRILTIPAQLSNQSPPIPSHPSCGHRRHAALALSLPDALIRYRGPPRLVDSAVFALLTTAVQPAFARPHAEGRVGAEITSTNCFQRLLMQRDGLWLFRPRVRG